jgi:addiction module RelE/StbE family toxin
VKRQLLSTSGFDRSAGKLRRSHPAQAEDLFSILELLAEDAFHPSLRTHKLKGRREGCWACSAGYDLRIVFDFVEHEGNQAILLFAVGTHDEVY